MMNAANMWVASLVNKNMEEQKVTTTGYDKLNQTAAKPKAKVNKFDTAKIGLAAEEKK